MSILTPGTQTPKLIGDAAAGAAGAAGTGGLSLSWELLIPIVYSLLSSSGLLGGGQPSFDDRMDNARELQLLLRQLGIDKGYQSPYTGTMDKTVMQAVLNNMQRLGNWGWPSGMSMDTSYLSNALGDIGGGSTRRIKR